MKLVVQTPTAWMYEQPRDDSILRKGDSELLHGETLTITQEDGPWVFGTSDINGYAGWIKRGQTLPYEEEATHFVQVRQTHLYTAPDYKTRPVMPLSFLSHLRLSTTQENGFVRTQQGHWIFSAHVAAISIAATQDAASFAEMFLGAPYLYGGRSVFGIDCSGLVGLALQRTGLRTRRDASQIIDDIGTNLPLDAQLTRNDLIFLEGHIGIMLDATRCLNATARHMTTLAEDIADIAAAYPGGIKRIKRIKRLQI